MKPEQFTGKWGHAVRVGLFVCLMLGWAGQADAQTAYACRGLDQHQSLPALEGANGTFFSIRPELQAHHSLADETVRGLALLTKALDARGTTLVLMPVPTRAQVLTNALPDRASHLGYQTDLSLAVHEDMIRRLSDAGVTVADARPALRAAALSGDQPFFQVDPRPNATGMQILAETVARATIQIEAPRGRFSTTAGDTVTLPSDMRDALQRACQSELPAVETQVHTLTTDAATSAASLVVVGTDITATDALNLPGFLSAATGFATNGYGVPKGGALAAISTYLTSAEFAAAPPRVLVWEWPVSMPLASRGPQPLAELIAAARGNCQTPLPVTAALTGKSLSADLSGLPNRSDVTLAFDTNGAAAKLARFHITGADGLVRTRSIYRHENQVLTGRFFLPLADLAGEGLQSVEIETDLRLGPVPTLSACF